MLKKEKAPAQTGASKANSIYILSHLSNLIKLKRDQVSRSFWLANYTLESNRQDRAARGHLWQQIGFCLALLVFRMIGRMVP